MGGREGGGGGVAVGVVDGAGAVDAGGVAEFVEGGGGLVLAVAGAGQGDEVAVVDWAL